MRAEVSHPSRFTQLHPVRIAGGRRPFRCEDRSRRPERPHARLGGVARPASQSTRTVLVVDDERSIRLLCRVNLGASGMTVLEAESGEEGLELARREQPDLILLDVMMPGLDGWDVARELAADQETRDIPVVFLTARADPGDRRHGQQLGGLGYVVKPFDPVGIGEVIENVLTRVEQGEQEQLREEMTSEDQG